jgi:putative flippase GtrA
LYAIGYSVLEIHYFVAAIISFVVATAINYILSVVFVFEAGARFSRGHEVLLVFLVSFFGLVINQTSLALAVEWADTGKIAGKLIGTGTTFAWNYSVRNWFVFAGRPSS